MAYEMEKLKIKQLVEAKGGYADSLTLPSGRIIQWPNKNKEGRIYFDDVLIDDLGKWSIKPVQEFLKLKTDFQAKDYTDPSQNLAIVTDDIPDEPEKKSDEGVDYTDPNQNPAIQTSE